MRDWQKASKAGVAARRNKRDTLKAQFIAAVEAGSELTKTGVVAPRTYQVWRKDDPEFSKRVDEIIEARRAVKAALPRRKYKRKSRAKIYGRSVMDQLTRDETYVKAVTLLKGRNLAPDIRESAISELVLMILSGEEPNAGKAVHAAKAEFLPHGRYYEGDRYYDN